MTLCKGDKCRWYNDPSKYGRKCFYEPQCILGWMDVINSLIRLATGRSKNV